MTDDLKAMATNFIANNGEPFRDCGETRRNVLALANGYLHQLEMNDLANEVANDSIDLHAKLARCVEALKSIADIPECTHSDDPDFNAYDYSGGNYDDAYSIGEDSGLWEAAKVAKAALKEIGSGE